MFRGKYKYKMGILKECGFVFVWILVYGVGGICLYRGGCILSVY